MPLFNPSNNGFGLLRLLFAAAVIISHVWPLGGFGLDPGKSFNNLGIIAVECFFALSGFLVTRSGERLGVGRFLIHRIARIFPGVWVAILFVALVAAPIVWSASHSITSYPAAQPGPLAYIVNNLAIQNGQQGIGDTLSGAPFPGYWNGPLYTLAFEFLCYCIIAALIAFRLLNQRVVLIIAGLVWVLLQLEAFGLLGDVDSRQARFTLCFFVGALVWLYREKVLVKGNWWLPAIALVIVGGTYFTKGFFQIGLIALPYLCIWIGSVLPLKRFASKWDYSYGMYVYGWPVLQLATFWGLNRFGIPLYLTIVLVASVALAAASWHFIEQPAMRHRDASAPAWLRARVKRA